MQKTMLLMIMFSALLFSNCAGVKVYKSDAKHSEGLPFYRPAPFLLVSTGIVEVKGADGKPTGEKKTVKEFKVIYLPDPEQSYVVQLKRGLGSNETTVKLTDGWMLTELGSKVDSKIPETISGIADLVSVALSAGKETKSGTAGSGMEDGVYRILISGQTITLVKYTTR